MMHCHENGMRDANLNAAARISHMRNVLLCCCALLLSACGTSPRVPSADEGDGVVTLTWEPPTHDEKGEPLTNLASYAILYGRSPDAFGYLKRVDDPSQTSVALTGLGKGVWYFRVIAVNSDGKESSPSDVVSKVIP